MKKMVYPLCGAIALFVLLSVASCSQDKGQIILINNSNEVVKLAHIEICKQVIEIKNLQPRAQATGYFKIRGDNHYDILIKFESGKVIKKQTGYVTSGFDCQYDTMSITEADVTIVDSRVQ